jgi:hypothetical protein
LCRDIFEAVDSGGNFAYNIHVNNEAKVAIMKVVIIHNRNLIEEHTFDNEESALRFASEIQKRGYTVRVYYY